MIIIMKRGAADSEIQSVSDRVEKLGYASHVIRGVENVVIGAVGDKDKEPLKGLIVMAGVEDIVAVRAPYKLASRNVKPSDTVIEFKNGVKVGGGHFALMAGPCSVETPEQMHLAAVAAKAGGAQFLRGGAYKPRTSPYSFQGLEEEGLKILKNEHDKTGLLTVTELISADSAQLVASYCDVIQIGARNMQNFALLKEIGKLKTPILLKRGLSATLEELLMSAEYIMSQGNYNVMLCERGIRTYEKAYRNTLDLNAVPALQKMTHLPIIADPSHGTGRRDMIIPMSKAAIAAGADGIIVEIHPKPEEAWSDGPQSLTLEEFETLAREIKPFVELMGKKFTVAK